MTKTLLACVAALLLACSAEEPAHVVHPEKPAKPPMPQTLTVVSLGDSLAYGAGDESGGGGIAGRLDDELAGFGVREVDVVNLGVNGAVTTDVLTRLKQKRVRDQIAKADAIILSIGGNDLFRSPHSREEILRAPLPVAERILGRIETIVTELHAINPNARVLLLGGYNPVPRHEWASTINNYLELWDSALAARFEHDPRVAVVKISDIVSAERLSRRDGFHPGSDAYAEAAKRIAGMLVKELTAA